MYNLYNTIRLGDYSSSTVIGHNKIYHLLTDLSNSGGVKLLVFVFNAQNALLKPCMKAISFHHEFFDSKVPIVIVMTGCENVEPTMDT